MRKLLSLLAFLVVMPIGSARADDAATASAAPAQPMRIYAIWDGIMHADDALIAAQMDNLVAQFGAGNAYHRPGFAFIDPDHAQLERIARIAQQKRICLGVIIAIQSHSLSTEDRAIFQQDLRSYQWRMKSNNWEGYFTGHNNTGTQEIPEDARDHCVPSPSRYSPLLQARLPQEVQARAQEIHQVMQEFPGVITCVNAGIEEELAVATASIKTPDADDYLADYSPFAITEYRDWLRHTGIYDDATGAHAGEGAPESITGPFVEIDGKMRSPFYDDPDPNSSEGTGATFNETFGTDFTTWSLKYWDTTLFPQAITDPTFNPMPGDGEPGNTTGGFDAPRVRGHTAKWRSWSWDYLDENNEYPVGNPAAPAFGFRQCEVAHFVRDLADAMAAGGVPRELMYAHQIPGEQVGTPRCRSSASPVWTGYLPASGTVGITCFGSFHPEMALQYANLKPDNRGWGIFEWHPRPNSGRDDPQLYDAAMRELIVYSQNRCRHLFAGWWNLKGRDADPKQIFWLNDSMFAQAIKVFMASTPDHLPPMPDGGDGTTIR